MQNEFHPLVSLIKEEFLTNNDLSKDLTQKISKMIDDPNQYDIHKYQVLKVLTTISCTNENSFKDKKSKKKMMEFFKNTCMKKLTLSIFIQKPDTLQIIFENLLDEREDYGLILTKIIQDSMQHYSKEHKAHMMNPAFYVTFNQIFKSFYDVLYEKACNFENINDEAWKKNANIEINDFGESEKIIPMRYSLVYYTDIMTHIMMLIDEKLLPKNEELIGKVSEILRKIIYGFKEINIEDLSNNLNKVYLQDLFFLMSKGLSLISRLLSKYYELEKKAEDKSKGQSIKISYENNPQYQVMKKLAKLIEDSSDKGQILIRIMIDFLKATDLENPGNKLDSFLNIKNYVGIYPNYVGENLDIILNDPFFNLKRNNWSAGQVNNIYYCWIITQKSLFQQKYNNSVVVTGLDTKIIVRLIENLIGIIFDRRTFPNFIVNALNHLKNLVLVYNKKQDKGYETTHENVLRKILQKLIIQMKIVRNNHYEIIEHLSKTGGLQKIQEGKKKDQEIFKNMPRYEDYDDEESLQKAIDQYFETEELDLDNLFFSRSNQRTYISPMLEEEEGLVINSIVISPNSKKLNLFIQENILMRIGLLNEICTKILVEMLVKKFVSSDKHKEMLTNDNSWIQINFNKMDYYFLKKVYRYNLQVYEQLTEKNSLTSFKETSDPLRFELKYVEIKLEKKKFIRMDKRQLYFMIEDNIIIILKILKNLVKLGSDTYPQYFQQFFDIFCGTNSHKPDGQSGLYMYCIFCEILIKNLMNLIDKLPEELDKFHFLYDEEINIHVFILKVLKYIFRTIRLKENANQDHASIIISSLKQHIFKLILVIIKLTSEEMYPIDYLFLMKIVFKTIVRCDKFYTYFTQEIIGKGIRILEFFIFLFKTGIEELKILSTELTLFIPLEIKHFLVKYPEFAKDFIPMITYALTLQESFVILRAIQTLDHIINSSSMLKVEVLHLLEPHAAELFRNLDKLMIHHKKKSYFFKPSGSLEPSIIPASLKILAKLSPFIRQLDIDIKFETNEDYQIDFIKKYRTYEKNNDPFKSQEMEIEVEDMMEEEEEEELTDVHVKELFEIKIEDFRKKDFKFDTTNTLISIFKTVDKLATKPTLYYYFSISPNLLFVSTLKHRLGVEKIYNFLKLTLDALVLEKNRDIEEFVKENYVEDEGMQDESYFINIFNTIYKRKKTDYFLIQKVLECTLEVLNFLHPFKTEGDDHREQEHLKDAFFTLIKKSLENENSHFVHNIVALIITLINNTKHQLTLSRETPEDNHFLTTTLLLNIFFQFLEKSEKNSRFYQFFKKKMFKIYINHLYSSDFKISIGAVCYLTELFEKSQDYKAIIVENSIELLLALFLFLNKLPPAFRFEIQDSCFELCRKIVNFFISEQKNSEDFFNKCKVLVDSLIPLIKVNERYQQKILIMILNLVLSKLDDDSIYKILIGENHQIGTEINITELLEKNNKEKSPFEQVLGYSLNLIENFTYLIKNRNTIIGSFKMFSHDECSKLSNMIMIMSLFFRNKLKIQLFDGDKFENSVEKIINGMLLLIKENEEFNEKKMGFRGSSVRLNNLETEIPPRASEPQGRRPFQPYRVNTKIYYQDIENDIHIDDHDFYIKSWSILIESVILFFSYFLTNKRILTKVKESQILYRENAEARRSTLPGGGNSYYPNKILELRDKIIIKMFELLPRVEKKIRESANSGFKYLLQFEKQIKEIMYEDKLVSCFRPLLTCLQLQDLQTINQNTLYSFKKLFKLFHTCFNKKKLYDKLIEYLNIFHEKLSSEINPVSYDQFQLINSIFILFTKMITNNDLNKVMQLGLQIESKIEARRVHNFSLKPVLMKVINQQSSTRVINYLKQNIESSNNEDIECFEFLLETLKEDESHPFRERVSREDLSAFLKTKDDEKKLIESLNTQGKVFRWTKLIRILSRKIPCWLVLKTEIVNFYVNQLDQMLKQKEDFLSKHFDKTTLKNTNKDSNSVSSSLSDNCLDGTHEPELKDPFITVMKILVRFCTYEKRNTSLIFKFLRVINLKINEDFGFVYNFLKNVVPENYDINSQIEIFEKFIDMLNENEDKNLIRLASHAIILPILYKIFKDKNDSALLSNGLMKKLREKITSLYSENDNNNFPTWVLVEMTLLLDYIIAKMNQSEIYQHKEQLIQDILIFAWKNISIRSVKDDSKLLKNMSKLLVSRLISKFNKLSNQIKLIHQLFTSFIKESESGDMKDEEMKHIWIKTSQLLIPQIARYNKDFEENTENKDSYWLEFYKDGIEKIANLHNQGLGKELQVLYNRYWNSILLNREHIEPHKSILVSGNKFYSMINSFYHAEKHPYILLDILLIFIEWYIKDYVSEMKDNDGKRPEFILGVSPQKQSFLIDRLFEIVSRDQKSCSDFLNRSYYLLRKYLLVFRKAEYSLENIQNLLKYKSRGYFDYQSSESDQVMQSYKMLRMNFVVMNIALALLYHPPKNKEQMDTLIEMIFQFLLEELLHKESKNYTKFPYLIPLSYQIMKRIIAISEVNRRKYLNMIWKKASESVLFIVQSYNTKTRTQQPAEKTLISLWVAILFLKLVFEVQPSLLSQNVKQLYELINIFIDYLIKKGTRNESKDIRFDESEDILTRYFICKNIDPFPESNPSPRNSYKGYSILIMRILVYHISEFKKAWNEMNLMPLFDKIIKKVGFSDYDLKIEALMLIKCIVLPDSEFNPIYRRIRDKVRHVFTETERSKIFLKIDPEGFLMSKETENKGYRLFVTTFWKILIEFLNTYSNSTYINRYVRKVALMNMSGLTVEEKDQLMERINSYSENYEFSKYLLIANLEIDNTHAYVSARRYEIIKKINLATGADMAKYGKIKSKISENIHHTFKKYLIDEKDYVLSDERRDELMTDIDVKTRRGKIIKQRRQLIFDDLEEEMNYRVTNFKKNLQEHRAEITFSSYRDILDMSNFDEKRNSFTFWLSFIKQTWNQSSDEEREKIWLYLNDLLQFRGNCVNDYLFFLLTLKELNFPFMKTEQMIIMTKKVIDPLIPTYFLEELYEEAKVNKNAAIPRDTLYYGISECFGALAEEDLRMGLMKEFTQNNKIKNLVSNVQTRYWLKAEELCEDIIEETEFVDSKSHDLKFYIDKHIVEECWVEVQRNLNEWKKLYEMAVNTERIDVLFESAYFLQKPKLIEEISNRSAESDNPLSYVYFMSTRLMDSRESRESVNEAVSKKLKEILYISLINEWYLLPKVFSEKHIAQLALSHFCLEFEEGWDLIQLLKRKGDSKKLPKIKDEILYHNLICRERTPHCSMGILYCKKVFEQRSLISHILAEKMEELIKDKQGMLSLKEDDMRHISIFNETYHNAIQYCAVERKFGVYSTIFNIQKQIKHVPIKEAFASQNDEFLYLKEILKVWQVNEDENEIPEDIETRLQDDNFNKDLRSDLRSKIMYGYLLKNDFERANENGIKALILNEDNWKAWKIWYVYYRRLCDLTNNTAQFLDNLCEMILCFKKLIKVRSHCSLLLFGEIIKLIMEKKEHFKGSSEDKYKRLNESLDEILHEVAIWTWIVWLPSMMISFPNKRKNCKLDEFTYKALEICEKVYPEFTHKILTFVTQEIKDNQINKYDECLERLRNSKANKMSYSENFMNSFSTIHDNLGLEKINDYQEAINPIYESGYIDSRITNDFTANCEGLVKNFKNQDYSQKMITLINAIEQKVSESRIRKEGMINLDLNALPILSPMALPNEKFIYKEKHVKNCVKLYYLAPEIYVISSGRKLKLDLEFTSIGHKKVKYTLEKSNHRSFEHFIVNHYSKLLNTKLCGHPETMYRDIKFLINNVIYLEDEFCLKEKYYCEEHLIDILDEEMENQGNLKNLAIQLLAEKKTPQEINIFIKDLIPESLLKKRILRKLNSEFDIFYWRKRYAQFMAMNCYNSLIFCNNSEFENLRIDYQHGRIIDDSVDLNLNQLKKSKLSQLVKMPLRLTKNNMYLLKEYMVEGVIVPTLLSIGKALSENSQDFDLNMIIGCFLRDFMTVEKEEKIENYISQSISSYYGELENIMNNYCDVEEDSRKTRKVKDVKRMKDYLNMLESDEYLSDLELKYRAWM